MDVFEKIKEVTAEQLDIDESMITMDSSFLNDLEADSLSWTKTWSIPASL